MKTTVTLLFVVLLSGCRVEFNRGAQEQARASEGTASDQAAIGAAAGAVLARIDAEDWAAAWDASSTTFKQTTTQAALEAGVKMSRAAFGTPKTRQITGYAFPDSIEGVPAGRYGITFYTSDFSRASGVEEQVVLRNESDGWRLGRVNTSEVRQR